MRLMPKSPTSHEPHTCGLAGSGSFLPLVGLEGSRQSQSSSLPALGMLGLSGQPGVIHSCWQPCLQLLHSVLQGLSDPATSSCHPGLDIFLPESSSLFVNTLQLPSSSSSCSSSQMWVGSCFQAALWAAAGTGTSSLCKDPQHGHQHLGTPGWQGWAVLGNQDLTGCPGVLHSGLLCPVGALSMALDAALPSCWNPSFPGACHRPLLLGAEVKHGWQELAGSGWSCWS